MRIPNHGPIPLFPEQVRGWRSFGLFVASTWLICTAAALTPTASAADGDVDLSFINPNVDRAVLGTALQCDGKILVGLFATVGTANYVVRINADGAPDLTFNAKPNWTVISTSVQADGRIVIAGGFTAHGDVHLNPYIARLNAEGSLDRGFHPDPDGAVSATTFQPDGKIVICGGFRTVAGLVRPYVARLNADGTLDSSLLSFFPYSIDGGVYTTALQMDGNIVAGGRFHFEGPSLRCVASFGSFSGGPIFVDQRFTGLVYSTMLQPDGKIVIGGSDIERDGKVSQILRLNADFSLDLSFDPVVFGSVNSSVMQADGKILIGGSFNAVDGTARNNIARLNSDGTLDLSFDANADSAVASLALQPDGRILIGGYFSKVGDTVRHNIARLLNGPATQVLTVPSTSRVQWMRGGTAPETFQVTFELSNDAKTWTMLGSGRRIVGGWELAGLRLPEGGIIRARARTTGGIYNGSSGLVEQQAMFSGLQSPEIAVEQPTGTSHVDGTARIDFGDVPLGGNSSARTFVIRNSGIADLTGLAITTDGLNPSDFIVDGLASTTIGPAANTTFTVTCSPRAVGTRSAVLHLANNDSDEDPFDITLICHGIGRIEVDPEFSPNPNAAVLTTALQANGQIVIGGDFTGVDASGRPLVEPRAHTARLGADGTLDLRFHPFVDQSVSSIAVQADGEIVIGGAFNNVEGLTVTGITRFGADGLAPGFGFNPNPGNRLRCVAVQSDGKIVIGGSFDSVGGVFRRTLARLNTDGTVDLSFHSDVLGEVFSAALQPDGKIVIGGDLLLVGATGSDGVARLNTDGTIDSDFRPNVRRTIFSTMVQPDGRIVLGGDFSAVSGNGVAYNHLVRLHVDGSVDISFKPFNARGTILSTALQTDGKIIVGGDFTAVDNVATSHFARLNQDGTPDSGFNPNNQLRIEPADAKVLSTMLQADGGIIIGGSFNTVGGVIRSNIVRLINGQATQTLTVPSVSRVQWMRSGTAPETLQVTFELSTDGLTWTMLGNGARIIGGWELRGLHLPANGSVRARARTTGGYYNASSGLVEQQANFSGLQSPDRPPTISDIVDQTVQEDSSTGAITFTIDDLETPASGLTFSITSTNPILLPPGSVSVGGAGASRTLTATPMANQSGAATITVTVIDEAGSTAQDSFILTVNPVNDAPTLDPINNLMIALNADPQVVGLGGITSGAPDEIQTMSIQARSSAPTIVPDPIVQYTSPNRTGILTLRPTRNGVGTATITVMVDDHGSTNNVFSRSFTVTVTNRAPCKVTSTNDLGPGSLREAIECANSTPGLDTISFAIPGDGPHSIMLSTPLPDLTDSVVIDGYTQTSAQPNTLVLGDDAVIKVEVNGRRMINSGNGLVLNAGNSIIRGLAINSFPAGKAAILIKSDQNVIEGNFLGTDTSGLTVKPNGTGVYVRGGSRNRIGSTLPAGRNIICGNFNAEQGSSGYGAQGIGIIENGMYNEVLGNYIGVAADGVTSAPNLQYGVLVLNSPYNEIGGSTPGAGNIISGGSLLPDDIEYRLSGIGVFLWGASTTSNHVIGNKIGVDATGTVGVGNTHHGVLMLNAPGNRMEGNVISANGKDGIRIEGLVATNNSFLANSIFGNGALGISLNPSSEITSLPNDLRDADTGPNRLQNSPVLTSAVASGDAVILSGQLSTEPNTRYRLEFFANSSSDHLGYGAGELYLGSKDVTTADSGDTDFSVSFRVPSGMMFFAVTATDSLGNTSEFSPMAGRFRITSIQNDASGTTLTWAPTQPGKQYCVESKDSLSEPTWNRSGCVAGPTGTFKETTLPSATRFYRVTEQ